MEGKGGIRNEEITVEVFPSSTLSDVGFFRRIIY
jgi:hypothetical protein